MKAKRPDEPMADYSCAHQIEHHPDYGLCPGSAFQVCHKRVNKMSPDSTATSAISDAGWTIRRPRRPTLAPQSMSDSRWLVRWRGYAGAA